MDYVVRSKHSRKKPTALPLRLGIVGMGKMGRIRYAEAQKNPEMQVIAICDLDKTIISQFPEPHYYSDYNDLVTDPALDAVVVCSFNDVAPDVVRKALQAGKHVFCEKPPARTLEEMQSVIDIEQDHPDLCLMYGFNHRKHYSIMEAKQTIDSGQFGRILWMRGVYGKAGGLSFPNSWRNEVEKSGGGILIDQGIHMVDLFLYFCGEFDTVRSLTTTSFWNVPVEDNAFAILHNKNNQVALLHSSATQWKHTFSLEIGLENGYINLNGILSSTRSYGDETLTYARRQFEDEALSFGKPREETIYFGVDDSWKLEFIDFANAILRDVPLTTGSSSDAMKALRLIHQIYQNGRL
ncbi:MAG: Gfo/Idh/MocA family oxidoreductase [Anaerolineae bacterium]|nr:Gfo/Idh/MocA family oxidoreductase [Anaerolineae bacterium]